MERNIAQVVPTLSERLTEESPERMTVQRTLIAFLADQLAECVPHQEYNTYACFVIDKISERYQQWFEGFVKRADATVQSFVKKYLYNPSALLAQMYQTEDCEQFVSKLVAEFVESLRPDEVERASYLTYDEVRKVFENS